MPAVIFPLDIHLRPETLDLFHGELHKAILTGGRTKKQNFLLDKIFAPFHNRKIALQKFAAQTNETT